jgi:hypothetical protein
VRQAAQCRQLQTELQNLHCSNTARNNQSRWKQKMQDAVWPKTVGQPGSWHKWKGNMNMDLTVIWVLTTLGLKTEGISSPLEQPRMYFIKYRVQSFRLTTLAFNCPTLQIQPIPHLLNLQSKYTLRNTHTVVGLHCTK